MTALSVFERGLIGIAVDFAALAVAIDMHRGDAECRLDMLFFGRIQ